MRAIAASRKRCLTCALSLVVAAGTLGGCTVYPEKNPTTLMTTTSAEQVGRIFWQDVEQAKWAQANALLSPNALWRVGDHVIPRAEVIPWLQSLGIHAVQVSNVTLTPAVNDINLLYTVQLQADKAVLSSPAGANCAGQPQTLSALAVWQQPQPLDKPDKDKNDKKSKDYHGYLLTVHDLAVTANAVCH